MVKQKKIHIVALVLVLGLLVASGCSGRVDESPPLSVKESPEKRGEEIVAEFLKRDAAPYRKIRVRFTIKADDEPEKIYEIDTWRRQIPDGTTTLSQIVKPAEDSDLGTLTFESKGQKTTVVTYVASRDEFRETGTGKMFFGGLTAGELLGEWDKFSFEFVADKELGGRKVFEVEGKLNTDAESVVSRLNVLFRADDYFPAELHLFDAGGREIRTYKVAEFKEGADYTYAARTEVENPIYKARIVIEIISREFPTSLDDSMFKREKLRQFVRK